jgi:hypothetical protein
MLKLETSLLLCVLTTTAWVQQSPEAKVPAHTVKPPRVTRIFLRLGAGMCYGYCSSELEVDATEAILHEQSTDNKTKCPDMSVKEDLSNKHWKELAQLVDHDAVFALPDQIGCPGCTDQVVEGVEVRFSDHTKKAVEFNEGSAPEAIKALSAGLAALGEKLHKEFPPTPLCHL